MPTENPNKLLVEGDEEKRVIPHFMDEHLVWGEKKNQWVVNIEAFGGVEDLLKPGVIEAESKAPGLRALGIIVDADEHFEGQWARIRGRCRKVAPDFPEHLPAEGLIHVSPAGLRLGVWIMPDNQSPGMLETFLGHLLIPSHQPLWDFARESCSLAKTHGATYKQAHTSKANIHTYLAWTDPPGYQLHVAVLARALDARSPLGQQFVHWFMELFQLEPRLTPLP